VAAPLLWILSLVLAAVAVWLDAVDPAAGSPVGVQLPLVLEVLAFTTAGALVASRRPRNPVGWLLLAEGLTWELVGSLAAVTRHAQVTEPGRLNLEALAAWTLNWVWIPAFGVLVLLFLLFPDGRSAWPALADGALGRGGRRGIDLSGQGARAGSARGGAGGGQPVRRSRRRGLPRL
jgi:hypothetical protein